VIDLAKTKISVVVPTHFRPGYLRKTLEAILAQTYSKELFEVLVVGFDKDKSMAGVEKYFKNMGIKFYRISSPFVDKKRNFGISKAKFDIVAFTDDDCLPEKQWLAEIAKLFERKKEIAGVEGFTWNDNKALYCHAPENKTGNRFLACNYAFKKSILNEIGGFDEDYHLNYREDTDLVFKMLEKGYKIEFSQNAKVFHPPLKQKLRAPLRDLIGIRSDVLLFKKFPKLYRQRFGWLCRGLFKLSIFAWAALAAIAWGIMNEIFVVSLTAILAVAFVKIFVEKKGRKGNVAEWISFVFFSYFRDLVFPFFIAFYWVTVRAHKRG